LAYQAKAISGGGAVGGAGEGGPKECAGGEGDLAGGGGPIRVRSLWAWKSSTAAH